MDPGRDAERVSFLGRQAPPGFTIRTVTLAPGATRPYDEAEWRGALVIVESGEIDVECVRGGHRVFSGGALLWLYGLPLRAIHNRGPEPAVIIAVTRADEFDAPTRSHDRTPETRGLRT